MTTQNVTLLFDLVPLIDNGNSHASLCYNSLGTRLPHLLQMVDLYDNWPELEDARPQASQILGQNDSEHKRERTNDVVKLDTTNSQVTKQLPCA